MSARRKSIWINEEHHHIAKVIGVMENKTIGEVLEESLIEYAGRNHPALGQGSMWGDRKTERAIAAFHTGKREN